MNQSIGSIAAVVRCCWRFVLFVLGCSDVFTSPNPSLCFGQSLDEQNFVWVTRPLTCHLLFLLLEICPKNIGTYTMILLQCYLKRCKMCNNSKILHDCLLILCIFFLLLENLEIVEMASPSEIYSQLSGLCSLATVFAVPKA